MKRYLVTLFLLNYLFSATEFYQFLKVPVLFEHFREHKQINKNISFLDFLEMHYAGSDFNDNDEERDNQLPFKTHHGNAVNSSFQLNHSYETISLNNFIGGNYFFAPPASVNFSSSYLSSIWQPPRFC